MGTKLTRRLLLGTVVCALFAPLYAWGQTADPLPPALQIPPPRRVQRGPQPSAAPLGVLDEQMPFAPRPIPGPADAAVPVGGMDARAPRGLPINLATAMQLAGVRPLDIAAATVQVEQALALQLQARALLIPTFNGGVDYFRHDGVQQNIFTGENFRKGQAIVLRRAAGPACSVGLTDAIYDPLAARRVVASRRGRRSNGAERRVCSRSPRRSSRSRRHAERCWGSAHRSPGPSCW